MSVPVVLNDVWEDIEGLRKAMSRERTERKNLESRVEILETKLNEKESASEAANQGDKRQAA